MATRGRRRGAATSVLGLALLAAVAACPAGRAGPTTTATTATRGAAPGASTAGTPPVPTTAATPATSKAPPKPALQLRSLAGIDEYVLANGMSVLLFPDPSQATVTVNITYLVGSRHEGYGETGMAHLLEHMMFKGTPTHRNVMKLLDERGADYNGTTWTDRTNYFETLPASADNLRYALRLEADRMVNATISADDLASEFSVVRNELEAGENDPGSVLEERVVSTAYLWHSYGKSTIGSRSDVEQVPVDRLRAFYRTYYQPDNAVLVVAGRFDPAAALAEIEASFASIPRPARTLAPTYTVEPVQDGERAVTVRRGGDVHLVMTAYHAVAAADRDFAAFRALRFVLADEPSGRLYRALVDRKLASDVSSSLYPFRDPGMLIFSARARDPGSGDRVKATLVATVEELGRRPVTSAELERWRAEALRAFTLRLTDSQGMAVELSEWAAAGDWRLLFAYRHQIEALTVADVNRVAAAYLVRSNRTLGELVPTATPVRAPPPRPIDLDAAVEHLAGTDIAAGEAFSIDLDNLAARTQLRTLKGGLAAALLPRKTRGGKVHVRITLRHGDLASLTGKAAVAALTAALAERGTRTRSFAALEDAQRALLADISIAGGAGWVTVDIETIRSSLPAAIDLAVEMIRTPALDGAQLAVVRDQIVGDLAEAATDPERLAAIELARLEQPWPAGHPRATMTIAQELAAVRKVTLAEVRAYHAAYWGAGAGEVVALGDFDAELLAAQLERRLDGWTGKRPYVRIPDRAFGAAAAERTLDTPDKEMAIVVGGHDLALTLDHPDGAALAIASYIWGAGAGSRLWVRLREQEGWSYGAWGYAHGGARDPAGALGFGAILAPQNAAAGKAAILEELRRLVTDGVTADEVATAKASWLEQQASSFADADVLLDVLASDREDGHDWAWRKRRQQAIAAVTKADVERVLATWFQPSRVIVVVAGDQAKARTTP